MRLLTPGIGVRGRETERRYDPAVDDNQWATKLAVMHKGRQRFVGLVGVWLVALIGAPLVIDLSRSTSWDEWGFTLFTYALLGAQVGFAGFFGFKYAGMRLNRFCGIGAPGGFPFCLLPIGHELENHPAHNPHHRGLSPTFGTIEWSWENGGAMHYEQQAVPDLDELGPIPDEIPTEHLVKMQGLIEEALTKREPS